MVPADGEFADLGIGGFAAAAVAELVVTARSGDEIAGGRDAQGALALLLQAGRAAKSGAA